MQAIPVVHGRHDLKHNDWVTIPPTLPPLVDPGPPLTRGQIERYSRHLLLPEVGELGQRRLCAAKVAVIGAGGLGSPVLTYLAAAGVGTIGIVDFDRVEVSNLQRQTIHGVADVGSTKTASAAAAIRSGNPEVEVIVHELRLDAGNALGTLSGYDLVIDGTDNFATRYLVNDACELLGVPYVWGSVFRFEGQASVFWARHGPTYRDVYPVPPPPGSVPSCAEGGVFGVLCAAIGSVMATEAIKLICGIGRPMLGRVLIYDALSVSYRTVGVRADPRRLPITALVDYDAWCGVAPSSDGSVAAAGVAESLTPAEVAGLLSVGALRLVDVREPTEFAMGSLPGAELIPVGEITSGRAVASIAAATLPVVLYCKSGARSARALDALVAAGLPDVREMRGGILAWIREVDPSLPHY